MGGDWHIAGKNGAAVKPVNHGLSVTLLVWSLVAIGLLSGAITASLVGSTLVDLNREQVQLLEREKILSQRSARLQQLAQEAREEIQILLEGGSVNPGKSAGELALLITELREEYPEPVPSDLFEELEKAVASLRDVRLRTREWSERYRPVAEDLLEKRTLTRARAKLETLRAAAETLEGRHRLEDAVLLFQWRQASEEKSAILARTILEKQVHHRARALKELRTDLSDLSRLVEALAGEDHLDHLADLKDNQLKPLLERLEKQIASLDAEVQASGEFSSTMIAELRDVLFGQGHAVVREYQTIRVGEGGLFRLAVDSLTLQRERVPLEAATRELYGRIEAAHLFLAVRAVERGRILTSQAEESLSRGLNDLMLLGILFLGGFVGLGGVISHRVRRQVVALGELQEQKDELNRSLETKVAERTAELEAKSGELIRAREELLRQEKLAAIGSLAAGVAHEINNPTAIIRGNVEFLLRRLPEDGFGREEVEEVLKHTDRIARITRGLLDLARDQAMTTSAEPVELNELLQEVLIQIPYQVPLGTVEVHTEFASDLPTIVADREKLRQIFTNLLLNALQAMQGAGRLTLRSRPETTGIMVEVQDTGPGIPPELFEAIFHPFFTTKSTGTGLGLATCSSIVQGMGGRLELENAPGQGALFRVRLKAESGAGSREPGARR
jgi:signal transduction histidine kinase